MSETEAIQKMAEKISDEIFSVFGWEKVGPINQNWACRNKKKHNPKYEEKNSDKKYTHPSDVVFTYYDSYLGKHVYQLFDLKSYAKGSISKGNLKTTVGRLVDSVECANTSDEFAKLYVDSNHSWIVHGVLFVYNHDGEYDRNLYNTLDGVYGRMRFKGQELQIIDPTRISVMYDIASDVKKFLFDRGNQIEDISYLTPDLELTKVKGAKYGSLRLDDLMGPWFFSKVKAAKDKKGSEDLVLIYFTDKSTKVEDFMYLFDCVLLYQLLEDEDVMVRCTSSNPIASINFEKAKKRYAHEYHGVTDDSLADFTKRVDQFKFKQITDYSVKFSEVALGMQARENG